MPATTNSDPRTTFALGIDGGGTKTVAWLSRCASSGAWSIIGRGTAGGSNPQAIGFSSALANLDRAIDAAFRDAGLPAQPVAAACAALAGAGRDPDRLRIEHWGRERSLSKRLELVHDALPLLAAGTPDGWGVALIAGTGSSAFGRNPGGQTARAGGWGYLMGDEGSGYAIVREALQGVARAADRRGPVTSLMPRMLERVGVREAAELISKLHGEEIDRATIAGWVDIVFDEAASGDPIAAAIVSSAACDLAAAVGAVCRQLRFESSPFPLALGGGLLIHRSSYRLSLEQELRRMGMIPSPIQVVPDPVAGALRLAEHAATIGDVTCGN